MASKDILECVQSSKSIIDTDSDSENASPVLNSSEMKNIIKKSGRGPRNSSWQEARSTPVVGLEYHTGDSTNQLGEIPRKDDKWRHHLSPPVQFRHGTEGEGNILQSLRLCDSVHKTFGPTHLTSTYSVCTRRVFGGIGHRTQAFRSVVRCSNH
ncbi:hypothetical protein TNCV_1620261 [Trichonephila clavipes]|nr:hypothetical protein TNCV_1620261 [Trichonephila clavipes]